MSDAESPHAESPHATGEEGMAALVAALHRHAGTSGDVTAPEPHAHVTLEGGDGPVEVDAGIAGLVAALWRRGIRTTNSCQGRPVDPLAGTAVRETLRRAWETGDRRMRFVVACNAPDYVLTEHNHQMAYIAFVSPDDARRFVQIVLDATADSDDPAVAAMRRQAGRTEDDTVLDGTFDDLLGYLSTLWDFSAMTGVVDVFDVGFVVRFPAAHVPLLTAALD